MQEQEILTRVGTWMLPTLVKDIVFQDVAQEHRVIGMRAVQQTITNLLTGSFAEVNTQLHTIHSRPTTISLHLTFNGRHTGHFAGIPPTGRAVSLPFSLHFELTNGRIRQINLNYDAPELLRQLGLVTKRRTP